MTRYVASPDVCLIQSRLFSPGYAGVGRWVLFDAATRRAFSAAGRDVVPDVVRLMARASGGATTEELMTAVPTVSLDRLSRLNQVGLLVPAQEPRGNPPGTFVSLYQRATFDYPFHDYSAPRARMEERALLEGYARLWPPPPSLLERPGVLYQLPRRALLDGPPAGRRGRLDIAALGWVLQHSFGPVGEIKTRHVKCIRRTSPSGGARHPAEVSIELPSAIDGLPAGSYLYDVARHGLVPAPGAASTSTAGGRPVFVVRARVERAMWRYRELRALRPVLLDVGHIVETLALLLGQIGVKTTLVSPPLPADSSLAWLAEPPAAALFVGYERPGPGHGARVPVAVDADDLLTNPAAVVQFADGCLIGRTVWPESRQAVLDETDFLILNHCVPSTRGDRSTTSEGVTTAVPDANKERLSELMNYGFLLPRNMAEALYHAAGLWVRHDWYLSLLAHLECLTRSRTAPAISGMSGGGVYLSGLRTLAARRTTRAFCGKPLSAATLRELLSGALDGVDTATAICWVRVFIAPLAVTGLPTMIHEWVSGEFKALDAEVNRELVCDLTTGQVPAAEGACPVWLVAGLATDDPAAYELGLVELGRLGQRICLRAADANVGVFLTPAIKDSATLALLEVDPEPATVAYLFSLGTPRSRR